MARLMNGVTVNLEPSPVEWKRPNKGEIHLYQDKHGAFIVVTMDVYFYLSDGSGRGLSYTNSGEDIDIVPSFVSLGGYKHVTGSVTLKAERN